MLTPGRGFNSSRLWTAEEDIRRYDTSKDARHSRDAASFSMRRAEYKGLTLTECVKDGTCTVAIWYYDGTQYVDSQKRVAARCWHLNDADTIPVNTTVRVRFEPELTWEITQAWCEVTDRETETGGAPGELSQNQAMLIEGGEAAPQQGVQDFGQQEGNNVWLG